MKNEILNDLYNKRLSTQIAKQRNLLWNEVNSNMFFPVINTLMVLNDKVCNQTESQVKYKILRDLFMKNQDLGE